MLWWEAIVLGLIQGLTEFLPISSSGHLVLGQVLLGLDAEAASDVSFEVFVHFGTVMSIITVFRSEIISLIPSAFGALGRPTQLVATYRADSAFQTVVLILVTMIPTGVVYVAFKDQLEAAFQAPRLVAGMLIVTGVLLLLTRLRKDPDGPITPLRALLIGVAQSAAMIPGISRSGATICTALYQNVEPSRAANFSFLMLLPVVLGATVLKTLDLLEVGAVSVSLTSLALGTVAAYVSGLWAIRAMLGFVRRGKLQYFAYYCFLAGGLGLVLL